MSEQKAYVDIEGCQVPVKIFREKRWNTRASLRAKYAILRIPSGFSHNQEREAIQWITDWLEQQFTKKPQLKEQFAERIYRDGDTLKVGPKTYTLRISYSDLKTHRANRFGEVLQIQLTKHDSPEHTKKSIQHLLSRVIAQDFKPMIVKRVLEINERYFQQPISGVKLNYSSSRWGSCSSNGNINLSTRLLFAPQPVIDYVIIHELAHRIEMNHSPKFWALVARAMPDYKQKERWLADYGHLCRF